MIPNVLDEFEAFYPPETRDRLATLTGLPDGAARGLVEAVLEEAFAHHAAGFRRDGAYGRWPRPEDADVLTSRRDRLSELSVQARSLAEAIDHLPPADWQRLGGAELGGLARQCGRLADRAAAVCAGLPSPPGNPPHRPPDIALEDLVIFCRDAWREAVKRAPALGPFLAFVRLLVEPLQIEHRGKASKSDRMARDALCKWI